MYHETRLVTWRGHGFDVALIDSIRAAFTNSVIECSTPPPNQNFAYVASVLDHWRLSEAHCRSNNVPHFSDWIGEEIIKEIKDRGRLIFDLSNEGPTFDPALFGEIEHWAAKHSIPQERVAFVQQNRNFETQYKSYCREGRFKFFYFDFYILSMYISCVRAVQTKVEKDEELAADAAWTAGSGRTYSVTPGGRSSRDFAQARADHSELENRSPFLCFNYAPRAHRVLLMLALLETGLLDRSLVSFAGLEVPDKRSFEEVDLLPFHNWTIYPKLVSFLPKLRSLGTLTIDSVKDGGNALAFNLNQDPYERVNSVLVSETDSTGGSIFRVTEKSIKPLFFEKPFLIHGNPFSLSLLRELGFKTFHPIIDETYDAIVEPETRFTYLMQELRRLASLSALEWAKLLEQTSEICSFNRHFLVSGATARYYDIHVAPLLAWVAQPIVQDEISQ